MADDGMDVNDDDILNIFNETVDIGTAGVGTNMEKM